MTTETPTPTPEAGPFTFERVPDPPNNVPHRGDRTDRILARVLWVLLGAMLSALVIAVILALVALTQNRPVVMVERTSVSAPMLDRALAEGALIRGLKEGKGAQFPRAVAAGDPLPAQVTVSGVDACTLAGGTVILQSDPPACDVDVPTGFGGGR